MGKAIRIDAIFFVIMAFLISGCRFSETKSLAGQEDGEAQVPNILLIVADDLTIADLSLAGSEISTPNIDRLASSGVLFLNFYTGPTCAPSRAMLMTGVDAHVAGLGVQGGLDYDLPVEFQSDPSYSGHLIDRVATVAERLERAGYFTFMAGKWHLGEGLNDGPAERGFQRSIMMPHGAASHFDSRGINGRHPVTVMVENGREIEFPKAFYSTNYYTDRLVDYIEEASEAGRPFFEYAAYTAPHWPLQAPAEMIRKHESDYLDGWDIVRERRFNAQKSLGLIPQDMVLPNRWPGVPDFHSLTPLEQARQAKVMATYAAMVEVLGNSVGRLVDALNRTGQLQNTIVIFMSDNGAAAENFATSPPGGEMAQWIEVNYPNEDINSIGGPGNWSALGRPWAQVGSVHRHLHKATLYEGGRSPLIISDPRATRSERGVVNDQPWFITGITPTILDWAKVVEDDSAPHTVPPSGISLQDLNSDAADKAIVFASLSNAMVIQGRWKLVRIAPPYGDGQWELFDLMSDPGEEVNLVSEYPEITDQLKRGFERYSKEVGFRELPAGWNPLARILGGAPNIQNGSHDIE